MPIVNQEQLGIASLSTRFTEHSVFESMGHLKPGVTPAQAVADLNTVSAYLEKTYPKQIAHKNTALAREGLTSFAPAAARLRLGTDAAGGIDPAGGMRQPRQPVRSTRCRPFPRNCIAPGARLKPHPHHAPTVHRGGAYLTRRRRPWPPGQHGTIAPTERVAAYAGRPHPFARKPRRKTLRGGFGSRSGKRIPLWDRSGSSGASRQSL